MFNFKPSSLALSVGLAMSVCFTPLANANAITWTITTTGMIHDGTDVTGVFGYPVNGNTYLGFNIIPYTQVITLDPSTGLQLPGLASDTVTVNGVSKTFIFNSTSCCSGGAFLNQTQAYAEQGGFTADGQFLYDLNTVVPVTRFLNTHLSYGKVWSYTLQPGDSTGVYFNTFGPDGSASFYGNPTSISILAVQKPESYGSGYDDLGDHGRRNCSPVPEPTEGALLLSGLGLFGFMARRKKSA